MRVSKILQNLLYLAPDRRTAAAEDCQGNLIVTENAHKPLNRALGYTPQPPAEEEEVPKSSRYKAIAELLRQTRTSCERAGDESLLCIVDAAYRICQACCSALDEVEWHQLAYAMAHQRQLQLLQELSILINLISTPAAANEGAQPFFPGLAPFERGPALGMLPAEYARLIQCIKDLLGPLPHSEPAPQEAEFPAAKGSEWIPEMVSLAASEGGGNGVVAHLSQAAESNAVTAVPFAQEVTQQDSPAATATTFCQVTTVPFIQETVPFMQEAADHASDVPPSLAIYFLSPFRVLLDEQPVGGWPNCKGKSIFKYLVTHRERPISKEVLMDTFWPEIDPDSARNNLNVAIYGLRKALGKVNTDFPYVLFQDGCYLLNPELRIWVDAEAFMAHVQKAKECERRGDQAAAMHEYRAAETIYQSEFLVEDRYEEWLTGARQHFQDTYLAVMNRLSCYYFDQQDYEACVTICAKTLTDDDCNEELHQRLMRCYSLMGYTHLALRQFHVCRETLTRELSLSPSRETMRLFEQIRQRQSV